MLRLSALSTLRLLDETKRKWKVEKVKGADVLPEVSPPYILYQALRKSRFVTLVKSQAS